MLCPESLRNEIQKVIISEYIQSEKDERTLKEIVKGNLISELEKVFYINFIEQNSKIHSDNTEYLALKVSNLERELKRIKKIL